MAPRDAALTAEEARSLLVLLETVTLLNRRLEQRLRAECGITVGQYEILTRLAGAAGQRLRMSELADEVLIGKSALTYQVTQLEKAGLVHRRHCPSDERGVFAHLTEAGRAALGRARPVHDTVVRRELLDRLPEQAHLHQLCGTLSAARDRMRAGCPGPGRD